MLYLSTSSSPSSFLYHTGVVTLFIQNSWEMKILIWEIIVLSFWTKSILKIYWYTVPGILVPFATKQNCIVSNMWNLFQRFIYSSDKKITTGWGTRTLGSQTGTPAFPQWARGMRIFTFLCRCSHVNAASLTQSFKR